MSSKDMLGRVATSRYTARVALTLTLLATFALAADPAAALESSNCVPATNCESYF